MDDREFIKGFPPIAGQQVKVLILGSMPSVASLHKQQYYGHPRNAFWSIMGALFDFDPDLDYYSRQQILIAQGLAVWDVLKTCHRSGSLDSAIERDSMICNDFAALFDAHPELEQIFFNGGTAEKLFSREILSVNPEWSLFKYQRLPSTSPAYAAMSLADKTAAWRAIKR